jgi:hypothetical protein
MVSLKKLGKGLVCGGITFYCSVGSSVGLAPLDFGAMFTSTTALGKTMEVSTQSLNSGEIVDDTSIVSAANSGDFVAQYVISLKNGGDARHKFNGERTALLKEKALLLLISAIKGNYWRSKDELKEVAGVDVTTGGYSEISLIDLEKLATNICEKL